MALQWISFLFLAILQSSFSQETWTCDTESLDKCIGDGNFDLGKAIIPELSDTELDRLCAQNEENCFTAVNSDCENSNETEPAVKAEVTRTIEEVTVGRDFMCNGHNRQTYIDHVRPCLEENRDTLELAGSKCLEQYNNATWFLNRSDSINGYRYCKSAQQYLTCQSEAVEKQCGKTDGKWAMGYHSALWKPHMDSIKCTIDEGMEAGAIVIISVCTGGAIYCIFFVVLGFARDSPKCKCEGLQKHTRPGYKYRLQKQESK